jgi:hypothetical protein
MQAQVACHPPADVQRRPAVEVAGGGRAGEQRPQGRQVAGETGAQRVAQLLAAGAAQHVAAHVGHHLVARGGAARHPRHDRALGPLAGAPGEGAGGDVVQLGHQLDLRHHHERGDRGQLEGHQHEPGHRHLLGGDDPARHRAQTARDPAGGLHHRARQLVPGESAVVAGQRGTSRTGIRGAMSMTVSASHRPLTTARRPARRAEAASAAICARRPASSSSSTGSARVAAPTGGMPPVGPRPDGPPGVAPAWASGAPAATSSSDAGDGSVAITGFLPLARARGRRTSARRRRRYFCV